MPENHTPKTGDMHQTKYYIATEISVQDPNTRRTNRDQILLTE